MPPSTPPARPRARTRRALVGVLTLLTAVVASLLVGASSSPGWSADLSGRLTSQSPSRSYDVDTPAGTLAARVDVELRRDSGRLARRAARVTPPTLTVSLRRPDGSVVMSDSGTSPVRISGRVAAGSYRLVVRTSYPLRDRYLAYTADLTLPTASATPTPTPTPTATATPTPTPTAPTPVTTDLAHESCGTWVLYQVSSVTDLERLRPRIEAALALPGVVGFSVRFPWDAVDLTGTQTTHPVLDLADEIARGAGKALSIRFMAGAHTPARVFDAGAASYLVDGARVPLPWDSATGTNDVFLREYAAYARKLAAWSRAHDVHLLHLSWYGLDWAELNHGAEVRAAAGYTQAAWLQGHRELVDVAASLASGDLAVELPLSGYGPLSGGQSAALADHVVSLVGADSDRFFVQANGWDETREWGSPDMTVEGQFDRIWAKPVERGLQMIQPDGYDWTRVFDRLRTSGATYGEVYLPSFWQVPGPTPAYDNNTEARIAQLEKEIAAFGATCS